MAGVAVKENVVVEGVVSLRWLLAASLTAALLLPLALWADYRLPEPRDRSAPPDTFIADIAHEHLVNLTSLGPRVAGSYENEVAAVQVLLQSLRLVQAAASAHNRLDVDVMRASGAFALTFFDGLNNLYSDVQSVVARARGLGGDGRSALLLNCHYDSVRDSPGASDDGAGCAVALEVVRALVAAPRPLAHDVVLLLNGAEENIMQASHAFITQHRWARAVKAFINLEACGSGGREVLFQAGPAQPWLLEAYAAAAPRPFASSFAQEMFESGLVPADTDFRVFRDFGNLSGLDFAWSSNGYVYHTRLDTAERVPRAALQRTGDNVLALVNTVLAGRQLGAAAEVGSPPLFFDVLGLFVVVARGGVAAAVGLALLAVVVAALRLSARAARTELYMSGSEWARHMALVVTAAVLAQAAGLAAALLPALLLHAAGARLLFYSRPALLLLYAVAALCGAWADARYVSRSWARGRGVTRGWAAARAWRDALALLAAAALAAGLLRGVRSSFVVALWTLPAAAALLASLAGARPALQALAAALGALIPSVHCAYLAVGTLDMFVPIMGRAGTAPLPPDVMMALSVAALTLLTCSWLLPLVVAARRPEPLLYSMVGGCVLVTLLLLLLRPAPYSELRPQRLMMFHTRRSEHAATDSGALTDTSALAAPPDLFYWIPELDVNTPHSLDDHMEGMREARVTSAEECARWVYCGAPYYLPVQTLVARGHSLAVGTPPDVRLTFAARLLPGTLERVLELQLAGAPHVTVALAAAPGVRLAACEPGGAPAEGPAWGARRTYFLSLFSGSAAAAPWTVRCTLRRDSPAPPAEGEWLQAALAAHGMALARQKEHARLLATAPEWVAATGWGVDLHIVTL